ncbi:MAG: M28 family peptidase, partial [Fimbriimonadaceae bacterium]
MLTLSSIFLVVAGASSWNTADTTVDQLLNEGKNRSKAYATLNHFTSKFGPRLTGSPNLHRAQLWAEAEFKKLGLTNVKLEQWGEVPVGFYRGKSQVFRMTAPWKSEFVFTTPAWMPGTEGAIKITPIMEPATMEEFKAIESKLAGAWIVMRRASGLRGAQGEPSEVEKAILAAPIAGKIFGTGDERVHTGGRFTGLTMETLPKVVEVRIRKSDYLTLTTALKAGRNVELEADIENHFVKGPVPQYNVIAELKGTEKPDEVVIICGHFDSWNGPGSVGANDNGTGSTVTLEAARLLSKVGAKPKRTIRFILWSGEEQGLLGSRAYVE